MTIPAGIFAILLAVLPPCPTEDSRSCGWDAQAQGNGLGRSFVDLAGLILRAP